MFRKNEGHKQQRMFTSVDQLPETARKHLEQSWAQVFYHEYFCRINEEVFSVLYSDKHSRPNTPINILVGFETLKSGFGLSDERLYDHFMFDLKFRYALGLKDFDEGNFELRTIYNFRSAVSAYEEEHRVNLIHKASEQITDEQLKQFQIKTGLQRMDSTMVQSNIRKMSRLQLLVEIIHRFYRMLSEEEQKAYEQLFARYVKEDSLHYCCRVKRDEMDGRLEQLGKDLSTMLECFEDVHGDEKAYQQAFRVFGEHFRFEQESIVVRESKELGGSTLQSPDDEEATFRTKSRESSRGYGANITETCDEDNNLQLISRVSVAPNITDDQQFLAEDIENLKEREGIDEVYTDAGYTGEAAAKATATYQVSQHVSAIKGRKKEKTRVGLEDFTVTRTSEGKVTAIICPNGQGGELRESKKAADRYTAGFSADGCQACPFVNQCPAKRLKKRPSYVLHFTATDLRVAATRKQVAETGKEITNKRASIESTVRSVIHPFGGHLCKLPVRGRHRVTTMMVLSAMMVNIRRIRGYLFPEDGSKPIPDGYALC
ncbi:transposase [Salinispira pacifica]|uniref:Transposase DDE domain-containing protein n=1 Tax=Salinispira pacifica TaxID=1307761 RepID=V5WI24_9SPIO|nr:transposase [Salinispira pacifica]AHC15309.1 hypothetical protein L21SP2_1938 [Salinispira pacifica]AHC15405.1 hypothetical protein L21SP2_2034 [Salinispira pacifica]AHC15443.1 hypothetical protein L21SP2_2076 [Salinispira pacifica]AHC15458.1 hypothetical protein L21SP2_2091 [Salinispira pacifica]AHC15781.1 hypothetical protein L21SP2_2428 [Salinispira pacifica]